MQFKALTVLALSALAIASPELEKRQSASITGNPTESSVLSVLATALPPSLLAIGVTNAPEVGSIIASAFAAGETPAWYSALPSDVKSYLPILLSEEAATATPSVQASISAIISSSLNTTTISSVHSASLKATTTAAGSAAGSASSAGASHTSTGGASYPSAVVGAGVAGALGLLGMLAL